MGTRLYQKGKLTSINMQVSQVDCNVSGSMLLADFCQKGSKGVEGGVCVWGGGEGARHQGTETFG